MLPTIPTVPRRSVGTTVATTVAGERVEAFVPDPLPPAPPLRVEGTLALIGKAHWELGRLAELERRAGESLAPLFAVKEAVCSSWIEGIESSVSDVLRLRAGFGPGGRHPADTRETQAAAEALDHGLDRLRAGFPTSTNLLCELHGVLLSGQTRKRPGQLRPAHVWIGGPRPSLARFVPPPPDRVPDLMGDLQEFFHAESNLPPLVKSGLAHVQFETIHPYLDGNGRAGRALIALLLSEAEVLRSPLLYLSRYFLAHQWEYYDRLNAVRVSGDWEGWMRFFLQGVVETARHAVETGGRLLALFDAGPGADPGDGPGRAVRARGVRVRAPPAVPVDRRRPNRAGWLPGARDRRRGAAPRDRVAGRNRRRETRARLRLRAPPRHPGGARPGRRTAELKRRAAVQERRSRTRRSISQSWSSRLE